MKNGFLFLALSSVFVMSCSSSNRRPASEYRGPRLNRVLITDLQPYLIKENHPEHSFVIDPQKSIDLQSEYFSRILRVARPAANAPEDSTPFLDAMLSCDAPFEFRDELSRSQQPGPAQVRFRLYDSAFIRHSIALSPSPEVTECRLFLKIPDQPKVVYGVRLVTQPDEEDGARVPASTETP